MVIIKILDYIFPPVCGICGKIMKQNQEYKYLCQDCKKRIEKFYYNDFAEEQILTDHYYDEEMHVFKYKDIIRQKIIEYKFDDKSYLYKTFSEICIKNKKIYGFLKRYDIIIPVPIHKKRKLKRGYNQSELISKEISKNIGIPMETDVIIKFKNTKPQSELGKIDRINNSKNVYKIKNESKIIDKNILLLDDVYTTGSTLNECSKMLKLSGCNKVGIITIAKGEQ